MVSYGVSRGHVFRIATKLSLIVLIIWFTNLLFVMSHELGHAMAVETFGGKLASVRISPLGIDGSVSHTPVDSGNFIVISGGMISTALLLSLSYILKLELAVYLIGFRLIECSVNFGHGSDMLLLLDKFGMSSLSVPATAIILASIIILATFFRQSIVSDGLTGKRRAPWQI